jgi:hypothetical protein
VASPAPSAPSLPCSERHGVRGSLRGYGVRDGLPDTGGKIGARRRHPARLVSISSLSLSRARGSNGPAPGARASRGEQGRARAAAAAPALSRRGLAAASLALPHRRLPPKNRPASHAARRLRPSSGRALLPCSPRPCAAVQPPSTPSQAPSAGGAARAREQLQRRPAPGSGGFRLPAACLRLSLVPPMHFLESCY